MENPSLYDPKLHGDSEKVENYRFNHVALCEALQAARANEPRFKDVPLDDMAEMIGLSRSNFQRRRRGLVPDPKSSTIWLICIALKMPPHLLMNLLPTASGAPIPAPSAEIYVRDLERRVDQLSRENEKLHTALADKSEQAGRYHEKALHLETAVSAQSRAVSRLTRMRTILLAALFLLTVLLTFDVASHLF